MVTVYQTLYKQTQFFFFNHPCFWCQEKVFAFNQSHFTDLCWGDSPPPRANLLNL